MIGLPGERTVRTRAQWVALLDIHPDDRQRHADDLQRFLASREPLRDAEYRLRRADGEYRWVRLRNLCVRDANGRPLRLAGSVSDIDDYKRVEAALRDVGRTLCAGHDGFERRPLGVGTGQRRLLRLGQAQPDPGHARGRLRAQVRRLLRAGAAAARGRRARAPRARRSAGRCQCADGCRVPHRAARWRRDRAGSRAAASVSATIRAVRCAWPARRWTSPSASGPTRRCD